MPSPQLEYQDIINPSMMGSLSRKTWIAKGKKTTVVQMRRLPLSHSQLVALLVHHVLLHAGTSCKSVPCGPGTSFCRGPDAGLGSTQNMKQNMSRR